MRIPVLTFRQSSMKRFALVLSAACMLALGCHAPGRLGSEHEVARPDKVLDFATLYKSNCAACHGDNGRNGAAIPLANPVYLALATQGNLANIIANGVPGKLMPPFAKSAGGMLTDQQVNVLVDGMLKSWSTPNLLASENFPSYGATLTGDPAHGQQAFTLACARCHGADGQGTDAPQTPADAKSSNLLGSGKIGSIVDPTYLTLLSDQYLRSLIVAGMPDRGMPDSRSDTSQPLTDQQITDIVAWLAGHRTANPGQPYPTQSH
ncbi:MAG: c-type cytochrome [Acidobacteriota bacterium]|nr:c-type cytochrome [Acidobacteriota bacterium]